MGSDATEAQDATWRRKRMASERSERIPALGGLDKQVP